jgi:exopolysaccharide biosynthesis WecB/TagA/CpsF family protein
MRKIAESITVFQNPQNALDSIEVLANTKGPTVVSFVNAHACNLAEASDEFEKALLRSDLLLRDGIGTKILLKVFGKLAGYNVNGTDLIPKILKLLEKKQFVFIGTEQKYVEKAAEIYQTQGTMVKDHMDGFKDFPTMLSFIESTKAECVVLGMGMPKQELFSEYVKDNYSGDVLIINGGAIFDFIAGRFSRAPNFMRNYGLEWLYRLLKEPIRLFKRYVLGIPIFFMKVIYARFFS